jgi:hypothetical protein
MLTICSAVIVTSTTPKLPVSSSPPECCQHMLLLDKTFTDLGVILLEKCQNTGVVPIRDSVRSWV